MSSDPLLPRKVVLNIFWCQWAYWCTLALATWSYARIPQGIIRTTLILTPILPAVLIAAVSYWMYQASDEYIRLRILRSVVLTALALVFGTLAYFFLELFGFPRLSMIAVNLFGWSVFNILMAYIIIRSR